MLSKNRDQAVMETKVYVVTGLLVVNEKSKEWCKLPYPDHSSGCPNYGKKPICPPQAPDVRDVFDFNESLFFVVTQFDLAEWVRGMKEKHPLMSDRQARCLLYWQPKVVKEQLRNVEELFVNGHHVATLVPEAMGVDVFATCAKLSIPIERNPVHYVHKVALVGMKKGLHQSSLMELYPDQNT